MLGASRRDFLRAVLLAWLLGAAAVFSLSEALTSDVAPVGVQSASIDGNTLTLTLHDPLTVGSSAVASDFTVTLGDAVKTVSVASLSGASVILTLASPVPDAGCTSESLTLSYSAASSVLIRVSGGAVAPFTDFAVTNVTDDPPAVESIQTDTRGRRVYITFCESVHFNSSQWSTFRAFDVSVNGVSYEPNDAVRDSDDAAVVKLELGKARISEGDTVTLAYDQLQGYSRYPLRDADQGRQRVASWSARSVTNQVDSPPTLLSASALWDKITLTFSETLDEANIPSRAAFSIRGPFKIAVDDVSVSGAVVTLTTNFVLHSRSSPKYSISYRKPNRSPLRQTDGALDVANISSYGFSSSTPDTKPQVTRAVLDGAALTLTFDMPLKAVAPASAFTISGQDGVTVSKASFQAETVTLTLSAAVEAGASISVSYTKPNNPPRLEGRNTRDVDSFSNQPVTNQTVTPAPQLVSATVLADGDALKLDFDLALDDSADTVPTTSSFSLGGTNANVIAVSISGTVVSLTLSPRADADESITISYTPPRSEQVPRLQSAAHSKLVEAFAGEAVINNADGKPRPQNGSVDGAIVTVTFDHPLDSAVRPAATAFTLVGTAVSVSTVAISGQKVTLQISPAVTHLDVVTLSYAQPADSPLTRDGHSALVESFASLSLTNLTVNPTPTFVSASISTDGRTMTVTMSHALLETGAGTPAAAAFALGGTTVAAIGDVTVSDTTVTMSLSPAADLNETVTLSYTPPTGVAAALTSADGTWRTAAWANASVNNHADGVPRLSSATATGDTITVTFDRTLERNATPPASQFTISKAGVAFNHVSIIGTAVELTLSETLAWDDTVTVSYAASGGAKLKRDGLALTVPAFSGVSVNNLTPRPLIRSVSGDGATIIISVTAALDTAIAPSGSTFSLGAGNPTIHSIVLAARTITLTLNGPLHEGVDYTLSYSRPTQSPLTLTDGSTVTDFSKPVVNDTDVAPTVMSASGDGDTLIITFDQPLDAAASVPASAFSVSADAEVSVSTVAINGTSINLTLSRTLVENEAASLSYTQPSAGGIADASSNRSDSFTISIDNQTDTPPAPVSGTIKGDTIALVLDQSIYEDPRFEEDDGYPLADFRFYRRDSEIIVPMKISFIKVENNDDGVGQITLTLEAGVDEGTELDLTYYPVTGTQRIRDDRLEAQRAEINRYRLTNLTDWPPMVVSAQVNGATLVVTFDQPLDRESTPATLSFTLSNNGPKIIAVSINGKVVTLTLAESVAEGIVYELTYAVPEVNPLRDRTANEAADFKVKVVNETDYAPITVSASSDGVTLVVTFDQPLDRTSVPTVSSFTLSNDGPKIIAVSMSGKIVTLRLAESVVEGIVYELTYAAPADNPLRDHTTNKAADFKVKVVNETDYAPTAVSASSDVATLVVAFDQPLDRTSVPTVSSFTLSNGGPKVVAVSMNGKVVTLTLAESVAEGAVHTLVYTAPNDDPLRDQSKKKVADFSKPVVNDTDVAPTVVSASGDGIALVITFNQPLDAAASVPTSAFAVSADTEVSVSAISIEEASVVLKLSRALVEDEVASLSYTQPAAGGIADASSNRSDSFTIGIDNQTDTPPVPVSGTIDRDTILIVLDQPIYEDPRFEEDDGYPPADFKFYQRDSKIVATMKIKFIKVENNDDGVGQITLTLATEVDEDAELGLTYYPATGTQRIRDDGTKEQRAEINRYRLTNLTDRPPTVVSAQVDGATLIVTFDQPLNHPLDRESMPAALSFTLSNDGPEVVAVSISGKVVTLTLAESVVEDAIYELTHTAPADNPLRDHTANKAADFKVKVVNETDYAPYPLAVTTNLEGDRVIVRFDQRLDPSITFDSAWFRFEPAAKIRSVIVDPDEISGAQLILELAANVRITEGIRITLSYVAPSTNGLRDDSGNSVASFHTPVDNLVDHPPEVVRARVRNKVLSVTFDQALDPQHVPPPDCEFLATEFNFACDLYEAPAWFSVQRNSSPVEQEFDSIQVVGDTVVLALRQRVAQADTVRVQYTSQSLANGILNLRDMSTLPNFVLGSDAIDVVNLSPAVATGAALDRAEPQRISISFDAELAESPIDASAFSVMVDGETWNIEQVEASKAELDIILSDAVPECTAVRVAYTPSATPLLDALGRVVDAFQLKTDHLIVPEWELQCVRSNYGGIVLTFQDQVPELPTRARWYLLVSGKSRLATATAVADELQLRPKRSVCAGDSVAVQLKVNSKSTVVLPERSFLRAAPCAVSAELNGVILRVMFDQPLDNFASDDHSMDQVSPEHFQINSASIAAVEHIEDATLTLRLAERRTAKTKALLSYAGGGLSGGGLAVGAFKTSVTDVPPPLPPPKFVSGFGIDVSVVLQFDMPLLDQRVAVSRWLIILPGAEQTVEHVSVTGKSVILLLDAPLPDEPDWFSVIYVAPSRGGLAGANGARLAIQAFLIRNYTETAPSVTAIEANARSIVLSLSESVDVTTALPSDFQVMAGRRAITVESLEWPMSKIRLHLASRLTALDAVRVTYVPSRERAIVDTSGQQLAAFDLWAENAIPRPRTFDQRIEEARLRAASGETTFARELVREFASRDVAAIAVEPGTGWASIVRTDVAFTVDGSRLGESGARIHVAPLDPSERLLERLNNLPAGCWNGEPTARIALWQIDVSDAHGTLLDDGLRVALTVTADPYRESVWCRQDLLSGEWGAHWPGAPVEGPSLIIIRERAPTTLISQRSGAFVG